MVELTVAWAGAVTVAASLASGGCRVVEPPPPLDATGEVVEAGAVARAAVVGGEVDLGDPAVVALVARRTRCEEQDVNLLCTGTLVAPRVVLTAAHCLDALGEDGQYEVHFGSRLGSGEGQFALVVAARRHPAFDPGTHEHDLALLRLATPAPVEPVALPRGLPEPAVGQPLRVVGFGVTAAGTLTTGEKRSGWMTISEVTATGLRSAPGPGMSCTGDSGGPVLATLTGQEWLVGVSASGDPGCRTYAFNARVDEAVADFIQPFLLESEGAPAGHGDTSTAATGFCARQCSGAQDCPAGLACVASEGGVGRCMLLSLREGSFGSACSADAECQGGPCARLLPEGTDACRCFRSCAGTPGAGGCAASEGASGPGGPGGAGHALVLLAAWLVVVRRRPA